MAAKHFEVRIKRLLSNECNRRMDVNTVELMVETERELIAEVSPRARWKYSNNNFYLAK